MLIMKSKANHLMEKVSNIKITKKGNWVKLDPEASDVKIDVSVLSEQYLKDITFGILYQLKEAVNYVNEHVSAQGSYEFSVKQNENILNLIQCHVKIQPRHASSKKYNCWIEKGQTDRSPISGWSCGCKVGARTVWCCAHDAFVL